MTKIYVTILIPRWCIVRWTFKKNRQWDLYYNENAFMKMHLKMSTNFGNFWRGYPYRGTLLYILYDIHLILAFYGLDLPETTAAISKDAQL